MIAWLKRLFGRPRMEGPKVCGSCLKRRPVPGLTYCKRCRRMRSAQAREKRAAWKAAGLCSKCGAERDDPKYLQCSPCRKRQHGYRLAAQSRGG